MRTVNPDTYRDRPDSCLIASIMVVYGISKKQYAEALGISVHYLDNKLNRNSFSIRDIYIISYLSFKGSDKNTTETYLDLTGDLDRLKALEKKWKEVNQNECPN